MSAKRILAAGFGFLAIILMTAFLILGRIADQEPRYQGRLLGDWLDDCDNRRSPAARRKAQMAVQSMGTNSIPFLMRMVGSKDYYFKIQWMKWSDRFPILNAGLNPSWINHRRAEHGFRILGPLAGTAVLDLVDLLSDRHCGHAAADALTRIGSRAIPSLASALANESVQTRILAARALGRMSWEAEPAVDALLRALHDPAPMVRSEAVQSLAEIRARPSDVAPEFIRLLDDADPIVRQNAAFGLGDFADEAHSALGALFKTLYDPDAKVRRAAMNALKKINPATEDPAIRILKKARLERMKGE